MLNWRGSSGSLWGRSTKGDPDILNGTRNEERLSIDSTKSAQYKTRRKGLRKRFLSLTEGLATFLTPDKKAKDKEREGSLSRASSKEKKFADAEQVDDKRPECRRTNSIGSVSSFRPSNTANTKEWKPTLLDRCSAERSSSTSANPSSQALPFSKEWKSVVADRCSTERGISSTTHQSSQSATFNNEWKSPLLDRRSTEGSIKPRPGKAPPSPPPRRYSLWALPDPEEYTEPLTPPIGSHLTAFITSPPQLKPPPLPPVRFHQQYHPSGTPPRFHQRFQTPTSHSPSPKRAESPRFRDLDREFYNSCRNIGSRYNIKSRTPPRSSRAASELMDSRTDYLTRTLNRTQYSPAIGGPGVITRCVGVHLHKENNTFGFTVRGGAAHEPSQSRPLIITHVRVGGPADREGTIKAGDRLLCVDGKDLTQLTLVDSQKVLKNVQVSALLTIEYDVSVMDSVRNCGGPILVEIERVPGTSLGLTLGITQDIDRNSNIIIESIRNASITERCGALLVGDVICAIDSTRLEDISLAEANRLLKTSPGTHITLEILPRTHSLSNGNHAFRTQGSVIDSGSNSIYSGSNPVSSSSMYNSLSLKNRDIAANNTLMRYKHRNNSPLLSSQDGLSHTESLTLNLASDKMGGYGIILRNPIHTDSDNSLPIVAAIDPGSPADKSSVISIGDRILSVNGRSMGGLGVSEVSQLIDNSRPNVALVTEFDVADVVVPSSGVFTVKLQKKYHGLGISITSKKDSTEPTNEHILICDVIRGSVTHRTGTVQTGDRLLAIDQTRIQGCNLDEVNRILNECDQIVTLKIQKDDIYSEEGNNFCIYKVELIRNGGTLGITLSGNEQPFEPIYVAAIAQGGLADRTGAIHEGDRVLAINGITLRGKPLSKAIYLLQNSNDTITLQISRPNNKDVNKPVENWLEKYNVTTPSVDSAVESWEESNIQQKQTTQSDILCRNECTNTVKRRVMSDNGTGLTLNDTKTNPDDSRWMTSSPHSIDSGQSEDKTDWDRMIEDLNQISETCGLRTNPQMTSQLPTSQSQLPRSSQPNITSQISMTSQSQTNKSMPNAHSLALRTSTTSNDVTGRDVTSTHSDKIEDTNQSKDRLSKASTSSETTEKIPRSILRTSTQLGSPSTNLRRRNTGANTPEEGTYSVTNATINFNTTQLKSGNNIIHNHKVKSANKEIFKLMLVKDKFYEDFGFSLSDGLYEKGVYVNKIRNGGPAHQSNMLQPFDRILQVNDTQTYDFDCCLTVPLIASAGDRLFLVISRNLHGIAPPLVQDVQESSYLHSWPEEYQDYNNIQKLPSTSSGYHSPGSYFPGVGLLGNPDLSPRVQTNPGRSCDNPGNAGIINTTGFSTGANGYTDNLSPGIKNTGDIQDIPGSGSVSNSTRTSPDPTYDSIENSKILKMV